MQTSSAPSTGVFGATKPAWLPSYDLVRSEHQFAFKGQRYKCCKKTAVHRGTPSFIWQYGTEARTSDSSQPHWLCNACWDKRKITLHRIGTTHPPIVHLREVHAVDQSGPIEKQQATPTILNVLQSSQSSSHSPGPQVNNLVAQTDVNAVKAALIRWICIAHIALSCVELDCFRELIFALNPGICAFLAFAGNTIRSWVLQDFRDRKGRVQAALDQSLSKIHISFDLWTSPNSLPMCGVVAHWLTPELTTQSVLLGLRRVVNDHTGENIAAVVCKVIEDFAITQKIGYFVTDNASSNDTAVAAICARLKLKGEHQRRRLRCMGHIINLAAKAFLFGDEAALQKAFAFEIEQTQSASLKLEVKHALELLAFWRKRGSVGKLHNLILWIRRSPQRRDEFMKFAAGEPKATKCTYSLLFACAVY